MTTNGQNDKKPPPFGGGLEKVGDLLAHDPVRALPCFALR
jgi:hypothetical protein